MSHLRPFHVWFWDANNFILEVATLIAVLMGVKAEILLDRGQWFPNFRLNFSHNFFSAESYLEY